MNCFQIFKIVIHAVMNIWHLECFRVSITPALPVGSIHITNFGDTVHVKRGRASNSEHVTYFIGSAAYQQEQFNLDKETGQVTLNLPSLLETSIRVIPC